MWNGGEIEQGAMNNCMPGETTPNFFLVLHQIIGAMCCYQMYCVILFVKIKM